ncbi:MAG: lamin tail domain-containing protein [Eubacteriales bacterium]|nr:lamin tail domain-containing protein [Eubacteriales bacterium]
MRRKREQSNLRKHTPKSRLGLVVVFAVMLIAFVVLGPKEPTNKALNINAEGKIQSSYEGLVISEVMTDNSSALPDENGQFSDWAEIWNSSDKQLNLEGVTLSDRSDRAKFIFPKTVMNPDDRIIVFIDKRNQNDEGRPFHAKFGLSSIGDSLFMFDPTGYEISSCVIPTLNANETYYLNEEWEYVKGENLYSPGFPNTAEGHDSYMNSYRIDSNNLVINEIMAAPRTGIRDEDGELQDWIEIKNRSNDMIMLKNYALSDNSDRPVKWVFPESAVIPPGGYYLVFCSGKNRTNPGGYPHTNFSIAAEGETITLSTKQGNLVDRIVFDNLPPDASFGRDESGEGWKVFTLATPGAPNNADGAKTADKYLRAINPTGVYISEAMSSNGSTSLGEGLPFADWAEIYNSTDQPVDISSWGLSDNINWPRKWQFPNGTLIMPGEYKVIILDKSVNAGRNAASLRASFALSRAGGETLTLSDSSGRVLDKLALPSIPSDYSYGRSASGGGFFYFDAATPGLKNTTGFPGFSEKPVLSLAGGLYKQDISVAISVTDGSSVRYTLDGSTPTIDNSQLYTGPISISDTCVLRARAFAPGLQPSATTTATYVMKTYYTMPVVCLTTDPDNLWNQETGMYASGEGVDLESYKYIPFKNPTPTYRLHGKTFRPGYAEMFDSDTHEVYFSQGVEFGLIGQYSLDMPQKSFKVKAKASLGERYFNAKLFEDRPFEQYKSLVLRVSGNDCVWTRMVDGVQSRLIDQLEDTTVINQAWRPVIVYLNGNYWGHYNLRERVSRYFVAQHEGIPLEKADDMNIIEASSKVYYGSNKEFVAMVKKIRNSSPATNPEDMQYILDNIDVDNLFDYIIFEMFFANTDSGNIRCYRVPGGKWRWIIFDMDYGLFRAVNDGVKNMMNPKGHGANNDIDNTIWLKILENKEMLDKFLTRFGEIFRFFTTDKMLNQVETCYDLLEPEMNMHFERWASYNLKSISMEQPKTVDGCMRFWNYRVDRLRNVIRKRPRHCYVQVKDWFKLSDEQMMHYFGPKPEFPKEALLDKYDEI